MNLWLAALFLGLAQAISPDRWMPFSVLAWQKGLSKPKTLLFSAVSAVWHSGLGLAFGLFFVKVLGPHVRYDAAIGLAFVLGLGLVRFLIFSGRFNLYSDAKGVLQSLALLGPAEAFLALAWKSEVMGVDAWTLLLPYVVGTFGVFAVVSRAAIAQWQTPGTLARSFQEFLRPAPFAPGFALLAAASAFLFFR